MWIMPYDGSIATLSCNAAELTLCVTSFSSKAQIGEWYRRTDNFLLGDYRERLLGADYTTN
jgi:hypothetical protein